MPGQGRKQVEDEVTPVVEGELVPSRLEELDEPAGRDGQDELDDDAVEMNEDEEEEEGDEEEEEADEDDEDDDEDEDEDEDDDEEEDEEADAEAR